MLVRSLVAAAALSLTVPALAQENRPQLALPASSPSSPSAPAPLEPAAFEARAERFEQQVDQMSRELEAAIQAAGDDPAAIMAAVDGILGQYRPEFDGFADEFDAFLAAQQAATDDPEAQAELTAARGAAIPVIRAIPDQIRAGMEADVAARAAAPAPDEAPEDAAGPGDVQ